MIKKYEEIINIENFTPKHPRMSIEKRAAQFQPFAALTGYSDKVKEEARETEKKKYLEEDQKEKINRILTKIKNNIKENNKIEITYFEKDSYKEGGKYIKEVKIIKKINEIDKKIITNDNKIIKIENIISLKETN